MHKICSTVKHFMSILLCPIRFFRFNHFVVHVRTEWYIEPWKIHIALKIAILFLLGTRHTIVYCMKSHHHWEKWNRVRTQKEWQQQQRQPDSNTSVCFMNGHLFFYEGTLEHIKIHIYVRFSRLLNEYNSMDVWNEIKKYYANSGQSHHSTRI